MKVAVCSISSRKDCLLRTIDSLMKQTVPCDIHVLLSEHPHLLDKGFPNQEPWEELKSLPVTVHFVPNWGSYRKNVMFMKLYPNDVFLAIDDDEEFAPTLMETIEKNYKGGVMAFRASMYSDEPYTRWENVMTPGESIFYFHKGNGGVVYDSSLFQDPQFFNKKVFLELAPTNDDIWVNLYRMYHKIPVYVLPMTHTPIPQNERLWFYNGTKNDEMIKAIEKHMNKALKMWSHECIPDECIYCRKYFMKLEVEGK